MERYTDSTFGIVLECESIHISVSVHHNLSPELFCSIGPCTKGAWWWAWRICIGSISFSLRCLSARAWVLWSSSLLPSFFFLSSLQPARVLQALSVPQIGLDRNYSLGLPPKSQKFVHLLYSSLSSWRRGLWVVSTCVCCTTGPLNQKHTAQLFCSLWLRGF